MGEIVESFSRICRDTPDRPLIYQPAADRVWTAADLMALAGLIETVLDRQGVTAGSLVISGVGNRPAALAALLACLRRGVPVLPVDAATPTSGIAPLAKRFRAIGALLPDNQPLQGFRRVPVPSAEIDLWLDTTRRDTPHAGAALLKLTSGSTGTPRATLTGEASLVADARRLIEAMDIRPEDVQVAATPLSHAYAIGNLALPLLLQGTAVVLRQAFVPQQLPADARRFGARLFPGVPFMFDHFVSHPPQDGWPASLSALISAGAPISNETVVHYAREFNVKIHAFYGTSETGGITYDDSDEPAAPGFVGRPLPGVTVSLHPDQAATPPAGRVLVRSDSVIDTYAGESDDTCFVEGGFLTGDLGLVDARGLRLVGRISSFIYVGGHKVQPDEVETVLRARPDVAEVKVIGVADERRGQQLVACVVARGTAPSLLDLRRWCAERLAPHKIPRAFVFAAAIPVTPRGKTDWAAIRALIAREMGRAADVRML